MGRNAPPNPAYFKSLYDWAAQLYAHFVEESDQEKSNDPQPILLSYRSASVLDRATQDGIMLYDPNYNAPVISKDGDWSPLASPEFIASYTTGAAVNGATISTGGAKVPFNEEHANTSSWATFNSGTTDFDLKKGTYFINGYVTLTKTSTGDKSFAIYLAESSDLTTAIDGVIMGALHIPSAATDDTTHVVPFCGQVNIPSDGTYAIVVNTSDSGTQFGVAHSITGYENTFSRVSVQLIGLNE